MIIVAHLVFFALMFGLGLPGLHHAFGDSVSFGGGVIGITLVVLGCEVAAILGGAVARAITLGFGINPLLQRNKYSAIAHAVVFVLLAAFLYTTAMFFPAVISVTWYWALVLSAFSVAALEGMVRFKRFLNTRSYR